MYGWLDSIYDRCPSMGGVSHPTGFSHRVHVGFDPVTGGFVGLPVEWERLLKGSALTENDMAKTPQAVMECCSSTPTSWPCAQTTRRCTPRLLLHRLWTVVARSSLVTPQETASRHQGRSRQACSAWIATRVPEAQAERLLALFHGFNRPSDLLRRSARTPRLRSAPKVAKKSEEGSRRSSGERRIPTGGELKRSRNVGGGRDRKIGSTMKTYRSSGHRLPSKKWAGTAESREMSVRVRRTAGTTHKD